MAAQRAALPVPAATMTDALFDITPTPKPAPPLKLTGDRRRVERQDEAIAHRYHPLAVALQIQLRVHPDAPGNPRNREAPGPRCGSCCYREPGQFPKCTFSQKRITHGPGTDVRGWWPACTDYQPRSTR